MNIKEALLAEHSKAQSERIADYIENDPERFAELMALFFGDEYRLTQRAAWVVGHCADRYPEIIEPHLERIIYNLRKTTHVAVRRNTVRILQNVDLPDHLLGEAADICFLYLANPEETVAVKVFSMSVLWNICQKEPDLTNELKLLIEEQMPYATAGFKSRGGKILAAIAKRK